MRNTVDHTETKTFSLSQLAGRLRKRLSLAKRFRAKHLKTVVGQCKINNHGQKFQITRSVLEQIKQTIGRMPAEQGGALGGSRDTGEVKHFYFDGSARRTGATYSPDHEFLNKLFSEKWNPAGINLLGFVHSHPATYRRPSGGDVIYAREILKYIPELQRLLLPIVMTEPDTGRFDILAFAAVRDGENVRIEEVELVITDDAQAGLEQSPENMRGETSDGCEPELITEEVLNNEASGQNPETQEQLSPVTTELLSLDETFRRVRSAYDLTRMKGCRVVYIGCGGAASFIEDMTRAGVGQHVLIDPDTVSETNLATQQVYRKDIGLPKVNCIAERILDINPNALVITRQQTLDEIDDVEIEKLLLGTQGSQPPTMTLICGLTDNFEAQARVNRLALKFGLPSLCAQVYHEGRAAEITFTYPGLTPACHRCILSSRFKAYLEKGFKNNVTSDGTPIFSTTRLNALKGIIGMAILHHDVSRSQHTGQESDGADEKKSTRWVSLLEKIGNRNLIQIRMDPDIETSLGLMIFEKVFEGGDGQRILFDDVVWLPQLQESPETGYPSCPDCGGTGNLNDAIGTFEDTRKMNG